MENNKLKVLFLCDSCRSQIAEGWAHYLKSDIIDAYSAGIEKQELHKNAVTVMNEVGIDISKKQSNKIKDFKGENFDFIITVCGYADQNHSFLQTVKTKIIPAVFDDPSVLAIDSKTEEEALIHYRKVRDEIKVFVESLPDSLNKYI